MKQNRQNGNPIEMNFEFGEKQPQNAAQIRRNKEEAEKRIKEDEQTNKSLNRICQILESESQPIITDAMVFKYIKHNNLGKRAPIYFHAQ